jgi:hypothetical protein
LPFRFVVAARLLPVLPGLAPFSADALRPVALAALPLQMLPKHQPQRRLRRLQPLPRRLLPLLLRLPRLLRFPRQRQLRLMYQEVNHR